MNVVLDLECFYSKTYSLKKMTTEEYVRDPQFEIIGCGLKIDDQPAVWFTKDIERKLKQLPWSKINLICHNAAFDGFILNHHFGITPRRYVCTASMARPIFGLTTGVSLAAVSDALHVGQKGDEVEKVEGKRKCDFDEEQLSRYGEYCKLDVELTHKVYQALRPQIPDGEMLIIDIMTRMFTRPTLELDSDVLKAHLASVKDKKDGLLEGVDVDRSDLMSNPKFADKLRALDVVPPMKTSARTGKETYAFSKTDEEFKKLLEHPNPKVQNLVKARLGVKSTIEETRCQAFIDIASRGTLPVPLLYYGAHSGRASGTDSINMQNLPRGGELRRAICAPEKHKLVAYDSSQIEARVLAWLAGEEELLDAFRNSRDVYCEFGTKLYGRTITKEDKQERFVSKACILGLGYSMSPNKFQMFMKQSDVEISDYEAERTVKIYRDAFPRIQGLWYAGQEVVQRMANGYGGEFTRLALPYSEHKITLPNKMHLYYPGLKKAADKKFEYYTRDGAKHIYGAKVIENLIQGLARIIVFDQMCAIDKMVRPLGASVALTVHDELVCVAPLTVSEEVGSIMKIIMKRTPAWCTDLPLACEGASGDNYWQCK